MSYKMTWKPLAIGSLLVALIAVWFSHSHFLGDRPGETEARVTTLTGHRLPVQTLAFTRDAATFTTAAYYTTGSEVEAPDWDVRTENPTARHPAPLSSRRCLDFAPGGRTLAAGEEDGSVLLWNTDAPHERRRLTEHRSLVCAVAFSRDGSPVAAADQAGGIAVWDVAAGPPRGPW